MDNLCEIETLTHMFLIFVNKQIINSFVKICEFFDTINKHTKMHLINLEIYSVC